MSGLATEAANTVVYLSEGDDVITVLERWQPGSATTLHDDSDTINLTTTASKPG